MDLQKFKETYKQVITESTNDSELRNFIRSIVEEVLSEDEFNMDQYTDKEKPEQIETVKDAENFFKNFLEVNNFDTNKVEFNVRNSPTSATGKFLEIFTKNLKILDAYLQYLIKLRGNDPRKVWSNTFGFNVVGARHVFTYLQNRYGGWIYIDPGKQEDRDLSKYGPGASSD